MQIFKQIYVITFFYHKLPIDKVLLSLGDIL